METAVGGRSKVLPVPYFVQPTGVTCQATCLRMMAAYLEQSVLFQCTGAGDRKILDIWKDVNTSPERPSHARNAHVNFKWWLERHFKSLHFEYLALLDEAAARDKIVQFIDGGMPVLMSVSHAQVEGHIILVIGYQNFAPMMSVPDFKLVAHDPYGRFDPSLLSAAHGARRWESGMSLPSGGETGPGQQCKLAITAVSRHREGDARAGTYYLLSARR